VGHACNPSYSGGRDQENCCSKSAWANSSERHYLKKKKSQKWAGGVAQGVGLEFKPQNLKKKWNKNYRKDTYVTISVFLESSMFRETHTYNKAKQSKPTNTNTKLTS
jgi:hypothetical protein